MIQDQSYAKEMSDQVVLFVTELFREKVELQHASIVEKSRVSECNDGEASSSHKDSSSSYPQTVDDDDELFMTALNMAGQEVVEQDGNTTLESHMDMFKKEVALEVKEFESFCQAIDWKSMVTNFPTAKTCVLTKNKEVGFDEANIIVWVSGCRERTKNEIFKIVVIIAYVKRKGLVHHFVVIWLFGGFRFCSH